MRLTKTRGVGYLGFVALGLTNAMIGPALPHLIEEFHLSFTLTGTLLFVQGGFYFLAVLSSGVASDYFGKKLFLLIGALLVVVGLLGFMLFGSVVSLFFSLSLLGMGVGALDGGVNGLFIDISGEKKGIGLGLLHMFFGVGALSGPLLFAFLSWVNWRLAFLCAASLVALFFFLLLPLPFPARQHSEAIPFSAITALLGHRIMIQFILLLFLYVGAEQVVAGWLPTYLIGTRHTSHLHGSLALSLFFIGLTVGRLLNGFIAEFLGYSRTLLILSFGSVVFFSLVFLVQAVGPVIFLFVLLGFFLSGIYPTVMAQAGILFPRYSGTVSGALTAAGGLGGMFFPFGMGFVSEYTGLKVGFIVPWCSAVVMLLLAFLSFRYLKNVTHCTVPYSLGSPPK